MSLTSLIFLCLVLPLTLAAYYGVRIIGGEGVVAKSLAKGILLAVSMFTYYWVAAEYLPLLMVAVLATYVFALVIDATQGVAKKLVLAIAVIASVAFLVYYKYTDYFFETLQRFVPSVQYEPLNLIQPLGISFLVFSLISYFMDVYRGTIKADRNLLNVALWAFFFAKIVSGPIVRYGQMFRPDEDCPARPCLDDVSSGARRFVIGLAKKVIIANTLGQTADMVFALEAIDTPFAWLGALCYTFQLFFDFAGYSDMALGIGLMLGFRFEENFKYPYISKTVGEFWNRWHISLSSWLRDYLYFPLGGSRRGNVYFNLLVVFFVSGLWHGASNHFVLWGLWYAFFMVIDRLYRTYVLPRFKIPSVLTWLFTMAVVVAGWVIFRASDVHQAKDFLFAMVGVVKEVPELPFGFFYYADNRVLVLLAVSVVLSTPIVPKLKERFGNTAVWSIVSAVGTPLLLLISMSFILNSTYSPFLYAQF